MSEDSAAPEPEDERELFARIGLAQITSDVDQLRASLVGYASCVNAVYMELLNGGFDTTRAQKMARDLWLRLVIPHDDSEEVFEP